VRVAIVTFPGSSGDDDCHHVFGHVLHVATERVWHKDHELPDGTDVVVLPGGAAYGDHLRPGALARRAPIMDAVIAFARRGGYVLGIGNGFQIACEIGLLPGALVRNRDQAFIARTVHVRVETNTTRLTAGTPAGRVLRLPLANAFGCYWVDAAGLARLDGDGQVLFRYTSAAGELDPASNVTGSVSAIAGITNGTRRVFGLMPHPERAAEPLLGSTDGRKLLASLIQ
jgi:phosphoribosylformylglycinamidine synthase I